MKTNNLTFIFIIAIVAVLASCRDKKVYDRPVVEYGIEASGDYYEANLYHPDFRCTADYPPSTAPAMAEFKITSDADPTGFIVEAPLYQSEYYYNGDTYRELSAELNVYAALQTIPEKNYIAINPDGDYIRVNFDNGSQVISIPANGKRATGITYWQAGNSLSEATIFMYDYFFEASSNPVVHVFSDYDPQGFLLEGIYTPPSTTRNMPFPHYTFDFAVDETIEQSDPWTRLLAAAPGEYVYIVCDGIMYRSYAFENLFEPLPYVLVK